MHDIKPKVRSYIVNNIIMCDAGAQFNDADSLIAQHVLDSTGILELVNCLEELYGFVVEDEEMVPENLDSLNNIEAYVLRKRAS
jgi:acyl carrier protein